MEEKESIAIPGPAIEAIRRQHAIVEAEKVKLQQLGAMAAACLGVPAVGASLDLDRGVFVLKAV